MLKNKKISGFLACFLAAIIMGTFGFAVRSYPDNFYLIILSRFGIGAIFSALYLLMTEKIETLKINFSPPLLISGISLACCVLCYSYSITLMPLSLSIMIIYTAPIIAMIYSVIFLKEKINKICCLKISLVFIGVILILSTNSGGELSATGIIFSAMAAGFYALFIIFNQQINPCINAGVRSFIQLLICTLTVLPFVIQSETNWTAINFYQLLFIGCLYGFLAQFMITYALKTIQTNEFAVLAYAELVSASAVGFLIFNETLSFWQIFGIILIIGASLYQMFFDHQQEEKI